MNSDLLVHDYLSRLERAAAGLAPERRQELLAGIEEHIDAARSAGVASDEAGMRTLLDRLGEPAEIVAAACDSVPPVSAATADTAGTGAGERTADPGRRRGTGLELAAVLMLTAGSFFLVLGWLVGVVLLWCSDRWAVRDKALGTLVVPLGPGGVLVFGALTPFGAVRTCSSGSVTAPSSQPLPGPTQDVVTCSSSGPPEWIPLVLLGLVLVASVAVPVWLYRTARRRAAAGQEAGLRP